jgi:hypothetical protein
MRHQEGPRNPRGRKLGRIHQLLVYPDDVNLLRDNINNIRKDTATVIDCSKKVGKE